MRFPRLVLVFTIAALTQAPFARAADAKITYDEHVLPIFRDKCVGCHNQDRKRGGLRLNNYTTLMAGGSSGEAVTPGDPDNSMLYKLVTHQQEPHMPPESPVLPKESLETIRLWIAGGAPENSGSKVQVANKPKTDFSLLAVTRGKPDGPPPMPPALSLEPVVPTGRANAITALAASPWAPLVALAGQQQVLLYHADTLDLLGVLPFPEGVPHVLKFGRNGSLLLAGGGREGKSGRVVVWDVKTGGRLFEVGDEFDCVLAADISADQSQIALGGPGKMIRVYSTRDGALLHEIKKHTDWIYSLEYSPDGVLLATGDRNGGLFVWEAHTGREYFTLRGHTAAITDISWRADSNVVASSSEDGTVRLWEMENGGQVKSWTAHGGGVEAARYALDGRLVSCGRDNTVKVWDQNGSQQRAFEPFADVALRVTFTHDAGRVIGGDWTGQVRVWNTADGKLLGNLLANPPTLAERLEALGKELTGLKAERDRLAGIAAASQGAADKSAADLAAAQKSAADSAAAVQPATAAAARAKDAVGQANAALATLRTTVATREASARALAEAAARDREAADKARDRKDLAEAAARSQQASQQGAAELAEAQKQLAELTRAAAAAADQLAAAQKAVEKASADAAAAGQRVASQTPAVKTAADKAAADKAAADKAAAAYDALEQKGKTLSAQASQAPPQAPPATGR